VRQVDAAAEREPDVVDARARLEHDVVLEAGAAPAELDVDARPELPVDDPPVERQTGSPPVAIADEVVHDAVRPPARLEARGAPADEAELDRAVRRGQHGAVGEERDRVAVPLRGVTNRSIELTLVANEPDRNRRPCRYTGVTAGPGRRAIVSDGVGNEHGPERPDCECGRGDRPAGIEPQLPPPVVREVTQSHRAQPRNDEIRPHGRPRPAFL
jgi:hypothetical protein